jgi:hypothetical protein
VLAHIEFGDEDDDEYKVKWLLGNVMHIQLLRQVQNTSAAGRTQRNYATVTAVTKASSGLLIQSVPPGETHY